MTALTLVPMRDWQTARAFCADEPSFECSLLCQLAEDEGNPA